MPGRCFETSDTSKIKSCLVVENVPIFVFGDTNCGCSQCEVFLVFFWLQRLSVKVF